MAIAANCMQRLIAALGLPQGVAQYGIGEVELRQAAKDLAGKLPVEELIAIYISAL